MNFEEFKTCGLRRSLDILSGKWKPLILSSLFEEEQVRFVELWRKMPRVSKKVLAEQLKQLEENDIIQRIEVYNFPPEVYYKLSDRARKLGPILDALHKWGNELNP
ncbi:winged helix-turn-helix transcriptional regulator [Chryseobacterium sp. YR221]|uniref:winged helix-turn-helix transcriptional regulator n=1 Tax=Chryseobacterium sp. YR221 TaxID=1500293 RepID=UPI00064832D5|nr:helix-turn-helix domain-containing protein [Chryseobacterium sp. YR221]SMC36042.1 transcriptional regulator, HxlR family [Chryseobacterium sp. YR221]